MSMDTKRSKVIDKVKALLARTVENGCTEAEAIAAARKVGDIMSEHNLNMSEIDVRTETRDCETGYHDTGKTRQNPSSVMLNGIDRLLGVKSWISNQRGPNGVTVHYAFFGTPADVSAARYLTSILLTTMEVEASAYLKRHRGGKSAGVVFRQAFSSRVAHRLSEMAHEHEESRRQHTTGTALVALKDQLVEQKYRGLGLRLGKAYEPSARYDAKAAMAGAAAGDRASLAQGITSAADPLAQLA